ncbi:hypothetical protein IFO70_33340 [Phormidium tenue FACHB-886]|nr:hypothetical protein [Phormidium tenue FACHB-886]
MATDKPSITVYIAPEVKAALEDYRSQHQLRSLSSTVEDVLKQFFNVGKEQLVTQSDLEALSTELAELQQRVTQIESVPTIATATTDTIAPHLTAVEAYDIARSRGYASKLASFLRLSPRHCWKEYGLIRYPGHQGKQGQLLFADARLR